CVELLRLSKAPKRRGVYPVTLRLWADSGKIPVTWVGRERRFSSIDGEAMKVSTGGERVRLEGLYVRVSGSHGQESSLQTQEKELRGTSTGEVVKAFRDRASGLRESARSEPAPAGRRGRFGDRGSRDARGAARTVWCRLAQAPAVRVRRES